MDKAPLTVGAFAAHVAAWAKGFCLADWDLTRDTRGIQLMVLCGICFETMSERSVPHLLIHEHAACCITSVRVHREDGPGPVNVESKSYVQQIARALRATGIVS